MAAVEAPTKAPDVQMQHDRLLILPEPTRDGKTEGGIHLPDNVKSVEISAYRVGVVYLAGPGRLLDGGTRRQMVIKPGDRVMYHKASGQQLVLDNVVWHMPGHDDIVMVLGGDVHFRIDMLVKKIAK